MDYTLVVIGADTPIGHETCRLGIAYGCFVYGVTDGDPPDLAEPWVEGVNWIGFDGWLSEGPRRAVVVLDHTELDAILERAESIARLVIVDPDRSIDRGDLPEYVIHACPDDVDDTADPAAQIAAAGPIRVEQLGMALLRAAIDDSVEGDLDHQRLLQLGASVMMQ